MNKQVGSEIGNQAPDFSLKDNLGNQWKLTEQRGKTVVLLFYPGDKTPVCTRQFCAVRDHWADYQATGAEVVGISTDSVKSHASFAATNDLPLKLLSDEGGHVIRLFEVKSWLPNRSTRAVIVIDKSGIIRHRKIQKLSIIRPKDEDILAAIRDSEQ